MRLIQRYALVASPQTDRAAFAFLVREFVSCFYPGTEPTYGLNLFNEHIAGLDQGRAVPRRVWAIRDGSRSVGYLTATRRLNGAVKLGPIVVEPAYRAAGLMLDALAELTAAYREDGVPYLYATYPKSNDSIRRLAISAGWTVAGAVRGLYRDDEEILIHRALEGQSMPTALPGSSATCFVRKRGGSVLLRPGPSDSPREIEAAGQTGAIAIRRANRICFSRLTPGLASSVDPSERIRLVDGTVLVIWR